ncbi:transglycosylase SLT domain-containing protein [Luteimonas sp. SJ-16]|uniref:Transglycosylase SLT domain-containing protein n=1 Tax=Luteimonas deserti TaxID=2752306 RepID=A0A7Z0QRB2_9GAMM|nr:lytic transglycosylase domain-containing protein [Luteimonas deserti]NYZ62417.1 transglycosylase SLT domain-containing protein [Luteimonas deserti]
MELMGCTGLAVPAEVMHHVVRVESSYNPYAIGVVGGRLARQPRSLGEAVSTVRMLEQGGYNYSLGLAQVNKHNLAAYGLQNHEQAFDICPNLRAGSRILAECYGRAGRDWGKAFSCYYSGNFVTGFRHGYVQKVFASWSAVGAAQPGSAVASAIPVIPRAAPGSVAAVAIDAGASVVARRIQEANSQRGAAPLTAAPAPEGDVTDSGAGHAAIASARPGTAAPSDNAEGPVRVQLVSAAPRAARSTAPAQPAQLRRTEADSQPAASQRDAAFVF